MIYLHIKCNCILLYIVFNLGLYQSNYRKLKGWHDLRMQVIERDEGLTQHMMISHS